MISHTPTTFRHTKIIATLGPATDSPEMLKKLILAGVDMIRLNMAHATPEWTEERIQRIRNVSKEIGRHVAVMMDVKGPEIRTGKVSEDIPLIPGNTFQFYIKGAEPPADGQGVDVNYPDLPKDIKIGSTVLLDSGLMRMKVLSKDHERVTCEIVVGGDLKSKRHINLPGATINLPALTKKDEVDLLSGIKSGIDFVALSFVREPKDVIGLREFLDANGSNARIISKIEDQTGVRNMREIVATSDGIMVARGDLGIEIDYDKLPLVQRELVQVCKAQGKPVIIATHLLESMIDHPVPTRAEISDVSNAVREQADAIMLSGETTTGLYPMEAIEVLKRICNTMEPSIPHALNTTIELHEPKTKMLRSAASLSQELGEESAIVVFTRSGFLGYLMGAMRAKGAPIFAFTDQEFVFRQLLFPWGVEPFLIDFHDDAPEQTIKDALSILREKEWRKEGSTLVVITNVLAGQTIIESIQLRVV